MSVVPGKRGTLSNNSANIQPVDHISTEGPYYLAPNNISGGLYLLVTTPVVYLAFGEP